LVSIPLEDVFGRKIMVAEIFDSHIFNAVADFLDDLLFDDVADEISFFFLFKKDLLAQLQTHLMESVPVYGMVAEPFYVHRDGNLNPYADVPSIGGNFF
jgi:hypothetical protein